MQMQLCDRGVNLSRSKSWEEHPWRSCEVVERHVVRPAPAVRVLPTVAAPAIPVDCEETDCERWDGLS